MLANEGKSANPSQYDTTYITYLGQYEASLLVISYSGIILFPSTISMTVYLLECDGCDSMYVLPR